MKKDKLLKWEYRDFIPVETLPGIAIATDRHKKKEFYLGMQYIIRLLWNDGIRIINYDHISFVIPKSKLPLSYKGEHFCISFLDHQNNLILLYMKVIPKRYLPKRVRGLQWQREKS